MKVSLMKDRKPAAMGPAKLLRDVRYLKGIGEKRAQILAGLGIKTLRDLLYYFPREWVDRSRLQNISQALPSEREQTVRGVVAACDVIHLPKMRGIFKAAISDGTGVLYATFFRKTDPRYDVFQTLRRRFKRGEKMILSGRIKNEFGKIGMVVKHPSSGYYEEPPLNRTAPSYKEMAEPEYEILSSSPNSVGIHTRRIAPLYPLTEGLYPKRFRETIYQAVSEFSRLVVDPLPNEVIEDHGLLPEAEAIAAIHFPASMEMLSVAKRRLSFNEFFLWTLASGLSRKHAEKIAKPHRYRLKKNLLTPFRENLPFTFTASQKEVIRQIFKDMLSEHPMRRLLQGDVGSGKTVVALSAMLLAAENSVQSVLMAPTEILAEQHARTLRRLLGELPVSCELIQGGQSARGRGEILERLASGKSLIAVGTHALLNEKVVFRRLGLLVVDEQHRFGVLQRNLLIQKGGLPDLLVMTATPIPRTLAMTLYGDLEVSTVSEKPAGRGAVATFHLAEAEAHATVRERLELGEQAFIVFPSVEETPPPLFERSAESGASQPKGLALPTQKLEGSKRSGGVRAAVQEAEKLARTQYENFKVGLIHGRMPSSQKEKVMEDFAKRRYNILIATTVVEVGIDIPNACVMLIMEAERYGLSTLHQLRGRVGRGERPSLCILVGNPKTDEAKSRFQVLLSTNDGFRIAEEDLRMRGPGDFFGTLQSGPPAFRIANLIEDLPLLREAREAAHELLEKDPALAQTEHAILREILREQFGKRILLGDVG